MNHNLRKLEQLILDQDENKVEYEGGIRGTGIFKDDAIVVQRSEIDNGCSIESHEHDTIEILVVYKGAMTVMFENGISLNMGAGDMVRVPPACKHSVSSNHGAQVISMLIPAGKGYPDVE